VKISIGESDDQKTLDKIAWIKQMFSKDCYKITVVDFIVTVYYVEFYEEKYKMLYRIKFND